MSDQKLDLIMDMLVGLKTDVDGLRTDLQIVKTDVEGLRTELQVVKTDVQGVKTDMQGVKREQQQQGDILHQLVKMVGENNKNHVKIMDELNTHEHNIEILNKNQLKLETEISKLKNR
ncbi:MULTISPECIES: hypothetical protein [unclassified Paenibacillus]|uniref:hypothetical protein n=1 Tax=unclassified Paenibacillus TaxID=185978 RepID=UPI00363A0B80